MEGGPQYTINVSGDGSGNPQFARISAEILPLSPSHSPSVES